MSLSFIYIVEGGCVKKHINWFALLGTLFLGTISVSGIYSQFTNFKWEYMLPTIAFSIVTITYASWIIEERSDDDQKKQPSQSETTDDEPAEIDIPVLPPVEEKELSPV